MSSFALRGIRYHCLASFCMVGTCRWYQDQGLDYASNCMGASFSWASRVSPDAQTDLWMSDVDGCRHLTGCTVISDCRLFKCIYPVRHLKTRKARGMPAWWDVGRCRSCCCKVRWPSRIHTKSVLWKCLLLHHHQARGFSGISWASPCVRGRSPRALPFSRWTCVPEPTLHEAQGEDPARKHSW